jgi:choline monooxygenase
MSISDTVRTTAAGNEIAGGPLEDVPSGRAILPARAYTGQAEFEHEQQAIFSSGWVWLGYEHWVPDSGDVRPLNIGGNPLLLVRDDDGGIRVFHNSCRHRGMALTEEPIQVTQRIQCAYHCWSFNLDGSLAAAPYYKRERRTQPDTEVKDKLGLLPVRTAVWAGMVFVDLGGDGEDFGELVAPLVERWDHVDLGRLSLAEERRFDIDANWKLVVENFLDFYHLPFIHPQVGPVAASLDVDDVVLSGHIVGGSYPRGAAGKAKKTDEQLPFLGEVPAERIERQDIFCVFPNALVFLEADWFQVIGYEPLGPGLTREHMAVFVDQAAAGEEFGAARKALAEVLFEVNEQDMPILHKLQIGRQSPGSDYTNLVSYWDQITAHFQSIVARKANYDG